MKENTTAKSCQETLAKGQQKRVRQLAVKGKLTVGLDLGDRTIRDCILDEAAEVVSEEQVPTSKIGLDSLFGSIAESMGGIGDLRGSSQGNRRDRRLLHPMVLRRL